MKKDMIWFALLLALCLLIVESVHGESSRRYVSQANTHIASAAQRLAWVDRSADTLYMVRAYMDLELCRTALHDYKAGHVARREMDRLLKQLDRDMEDYPPRHLPGKTTEPASASR